MTGFGWMVDRAGFSIVGDGFPAVHPALGDVEGRLGYLLHRTDLLHMDVLRDRLSLIGLTPARATAIVYVSNNPGCGQSQLARALDVNRASAMEMINLLEAFGAINRRPGRDRRSNALWITAKGKSLHESFLEITSELDELIAHDLDDVERAVLDQLLRKVRASLGRNLSTNDKK